MADKKEQGFNDSELQDIMSEIESLEREYDEDQPETVEATHDQPVNEVEETLNTVEEVVEAQATTKKDNIVKFAPKAAAGENQVEFHGAGQVNFSLNFEVAGQTAHLEITDQGLVVSLDGMHLSIDEANGCSVEMEGGVKFSVPMGDHASAKKAA